MGGQKLLGLLFFIWRLYLTMIKEDLEPTYDFLGTVKPVKHHINKFSL